MDQEWRKTLARLLEHLGEQGWMGLEVPAAAGVLEAAALLVAQGAGSDCIESALFLVVDRAGGPGPVEPSPGVRETLGWVRGLAFLQDILDAGGAEAAYEYLAPAPPERKSLLLALAVAELRMLGLARLEAGGGRWLTRAAPGWLKRHQILGRILAGSGPEALTAEFHFRMAALGRRTRNHLLASGALGHRDLLFSLDAWALCELLKRADRDGLTAALVDPDWQGVRERFEACMPRGAVRNLEDELSYLAPDPARARAAQEELVEQVLILEEEGVLRVPGFEGMRPPEPVLATLDRLVLEGALGSLDPQEAQRLLHRVDLRNLAFALVETPRPARIHLFRNFPPGTLARLEAEYRRNPWSRPDPKAMARAVAEEVRRLRNEG